MELMLREHQMKAIDALREGFKKGHRCQLLYAPTGYGKCLGEGTPVLMYDGTIRPVEDIREGDLVISPNGEPRRVYAVTQGVDMLYKVTPTKGDPYVVNSQHILSLRTTGSNEIINIGVEEYLQKSKTFRHCAKGWRSYAIPFAEKPLEVDPYILGVWLGDGTTLEPAISTMDQEVVDSIYEYANENGHRVSIWRDKRCNTYRICENGFFSKLKGLKVIGNKHIPHKYKTGSIEQRLQLMAGIIDTDGYLNGGVYDLVLKQKQFVEDVCFVARSLGLAAYAQECTKTIKDRNFAGTYYRIIISGDIDKIPCRVARRKASPRKINKNALNVGITVEPIGQGKYFGFAIDGPDKLFLLGDFTVTHNTECSIYLMKATADNYKRAVMLMDRIVLVDQTSQRLDKYKLDHGVYQANHWRYRPLERLQVCSAQTLERRDNFPETDLLIVDECHIARQQTIEFIKSRPNMRVIGLTATPFTKGLGDVYTHVVTGSPTEFLVTNKWLAPLRVFIAKEIDMTGAKKVAGEWSTDEVTERGRKLTGDIVETWIKKTHEIFGAPRKTIVFCAGVAHGSDLVEQFARHGYNFVSISYKDDDEFKRDAIADFSKPDTQIHGLIATDILTRGFDVPDVMIGVSARPFSKSLSSHVQQMGRVMRSHPGKEYGVWLCLAKGSRVLTDAGLVPIDKVKLHHKIWDGTNFVSHGGAVCNGIQKVISYQGLTATPGHLVHTSEGWRSLGDCAAQQIRITQTGIGGKAVRLGENFRSECFLVGSKAQKICSRFMRVRDMWIQKFNFFGKFKKRKNERLQGLQSTRPNLSNVALQQGSGYSGAMFGKNTCSLPCVWWSWNRVSILWGKARNIVDHAEPWFAKLFIGRGKIKNSIGSHRPEWTLRTWKSTLAFCGVEPAQQTWQPVRGSDAQVQDRSSRNSIFRQHVEAFILGWNDSRANRGKVQTSIDQTEREVWDILDAGPHNRFTCEGLLVHNCHSGNYIRFRDDWDKVYAEGVDTLDETVDKPRKEPTEKEKKESKCPACGFLWPAKADACPACGHVRQRLSAIHTVPGEMEELGAGSRDDRQSFYSQLIFIANDRGYNRGWAAHKYKEKFGVWPRNLKEVTMIPEMKTLNWIRSRQIAWAKSKKRRAA